MKPPSGRPHSTSRECRNSPWSVQLTMSVVEVEAVVKVCGLAKYRQRLKLAAGEVPCLTLTMKKDEPVLDAALALVEDLKLARESAES